MPNPVNSTGFNPSALVHASKTYASNPGTDTLNCLKCSASEAKTKGLEQLDLAGQLDKAAFKSATSNGRNNASVSLCKTLGEALIKDNPALQQINLSDCYLTSRGRSAILESISIANTALTHLNLSTTRGISDGPKLRKMEMHALNKLLIENRSLTDLKLGEITHSQKRQLLKTAAANPVLREISFGQDHFQLRTPLSNTPVAPPEEATLDDGLMFDLQDLDNDPVIANSNPNQPFAYSKMSAQGPTWSQFKDWEEDPSRM